VCDCIVWSVPCGADQTVFHRPVRLEPSLSHGMVRAWWCRRGSSLFSAVTNYLDYLEFDALRHGTPEDVFDRLVLTSFVDEVRPLNRTLPRRSEPEPTM